MEALVSLLHAIGVLVLLAIVLAIFGFVCLELRWILSIWSQNRENPWL
jgi:hypothetical protein